MIRTQIPPCSLSRRFHGSGGKVTFDSSYRKDDVVYRTFQELGHGHFSFSRHSLSSKSCRRSRLHRKPNDDIGRS
ncbi:hypothetical protein POX_a01846 [Penicillium oxalicum]|uniref:hypothetical protein n=1 Tax=Penicillium oxalicum TaxID=69781 RepID=UPI0020B6809B|nr:hypothetical protein POX_a01846 [Penicillium oxalicum]KAI2795241.1 hypothetical protein POX_a01846 [Penicillium oxalicum]